jgi:hypothetical protein
METKAILAGLLLWVLAIAIWLYVLVTVRLNVGEAWALLVPPLVLAGITAALHHLFRGRTNALPICAIAAAILAKVFVFVATWLNHLLR